MNASIGFLARLREEIVRVATSGAASEANARSKRTPGRLILATTLGLALALAIALMARALLFSSGTPAPSQGQGPPLPIGTVDPAVPTGPPVFGAACPAPPMAGDGLWAISEASADDIWAVGRHRPSAEASFRGLIEHWDGTSWQIVDAPDIGPLLAVEAISPKNVWVTSDGKFLHWDGAGWRIYRAEASDPVLHALAAAAPEDVWAVGSQSYPIGRHHFGLAGLVEHWDGTSWQIAAIPDPAPGHSALSSVLAVSNTDAWAVGTYDTSDSTIHPLLLHWDGVSWSRASPPGEDPRGSGLLAVGSDHAGGLWLAGQYQEGGRPAFFARLVGSTWEIVPSPITKGDEIPVSIDGSGPRDVWAVGAGNQASGKIHQHWDGEAWRIFPSPGQHPWWGGSPNAVAVVSPTDAWAVGERSVSRQVTGALIEHWDGSAWTVVDPPATEVTPPPPPSCGRATP
jgi:hypothetical protein